MSQRPPSLIAYARELRDLIESCFAAPDDTGDQASIKGKLPPLDKAFHLVQAELRGSDEVPQIVVLFNWDGEDDLFGLSYPISLQDFKSFDSPEQYVLIYVHDDLAALGLGLKTAIQAVQSGVTWLRWRP